MAKTIVILGANYTGIPIAHYLLRHTAQTVKDLKVIIVSPNTHMYWHVASIRYILPNMLPSDKVFLPIAPAFTKYPSKQYEIVLGKAEKLDPSSNSVQVVTNDGLSRTIKYDAVVIATGASFKEDMPFKMLSSTEATMDKLQAYSKQIAAANSIVVAGAGITGVELAAELGTEYGSQKQITLIADKDLPLAESCMTEVREVVRKDLGKLKVKIIPNAKVSGVSSTGPDGSSTIELSRTNGEKETIKTDLFLPTFGLVPNTQFCPDEMLDSRGLVNQTTQLRAQGYDNVFVVGDAGNLEPPQGRTADDQAVHLVKILGAYLAGEPLPEYQPASKIVLGISLGKKKGTGQMGNWRPWGFMIAYFKSRYLGTDFASAFVAGSRTVGAKTWA